MADDWEDWEERPLELTGQPAAQFETKGQEILAKLNEPDAKKFEGEDAEDDAAPSWDSSVPKPEKKKESTKKSYEDKGAVSYDVPLDDPVAEKLRRQRLQEESDLEAARAAFGLGVDEVDLESLNPKTQKEFEDYGRIVSAKYITQYNKSKFYKELLKAFLKSSLAPLDVQQTKDLEACLAGIRTDKLKEEQAAKAKAKGDRKKKALNVGRSGGSAGLDDYSFDGAPLDDDDYDFM